MKTSHFLVGWFLSILMIVWLVSAFNDAPIQETIQPNGRNEKFATIVKKLTPKIDESIADLEKNLDRKFGDNKEKKIASLDNIIAKIDKVLGKTGISEKNQAIYIFLKVKVLSLIQQIQNPNQWQGKCGDNVCDMAEKANPNLCPKDCAGEQPVPSVPTTTTPKTENIVSVKSSPGESPFGFNPGNSNNYSFSKELGTKWSRDGLYLIWEWIDANRNGDYKFTEATAPAKPNIPNSGGKINYDRAWLNAPKGTKLILNVCPFRIGGDFKNSEEPATYQNFVEKTVERYDGDDDLGCSLSSPDCYKKGDGQYPSSEVIQVFKNNPIKYWQVCNHVTDASEKGKTTNYASQFAVVQEKTYKGVKVADSGALVLIAGDSSKKLSCFSTTG